RIIEKADPAKKYDPPKTETSFLHDVKILPE
ncbi:unnamed protein product, partial [marine sediment metagenome]